MQLVDSHCHIDFDDLLPDLSNVLARAAENDVAYLMCVSVNLEDFPRIKKIADESAAEFAAKSPDELPNELNGKNAPRIYASVGVHPNHTGGHDPSADELTALADDPNVIAIGETGLDYFRKDDKPDWQRARFENHIAAARAADKPLIVHTRAAADDTMDMLESLDAERAGGVMHCFAEDWATAKRALDIGFYISFSGIVTFNNARDLQALAKKVPLESILVETDAPYLAPTPHRGKVNEPSFVRHTAMHLAELRDDTLDNIAHATTENFFRLFSCAVR